jgi:hypothetical protein
MGSHTSWPSVELSYLDEFGTIHPEVYSAAGELWPKAEQFALLTLHDAPAGLRLMLKAAAKVSRLVEEDRPFGEIRDLKAYLFKVFKRLVLSELEKEVGHREIAMRLEMGASPEIEKVANQLERKILIDELIQRMDSRTRHTFEELVLGHSFEEIAARRKVKANVLRSGFQKRIKRLAESLRKEVEESGVSVD